MTANVKPAKYNQLRVMEPSLSQVFDNFYTKLLSNKNFASYFKNEEVIRQLIIKQKANFLRSIEMTQEELSERFQYLGKFHFEKQVSYIVFVRGAEILRDEMISYGVKENLPAEVFKDLYMYTGETTNLMAKGYLKELLRSDLEELGRVREAILKINSPEAKVSIEHFNWLENLILGIMEGERGNLSPEIFNRILENVPDSNSFLGRRIYSVDYIENLYQGLKRNLLSLCYFLEEGTFVSILPIYASLLTIYKLLLHLTNAISWEKNYESALKVVEVELSARETKMFASMMAHDLKTPLAGIIGFNNLILSELSDCSLDDIKNHISRTLGIARNMNVLIEELLALSMAKAKDINKVKISIKRIMEDVRLNLSSLILKSHAVIVEENPDEEVFVDRFLFTQVLQNVIANSLKYKSDKIPKVTVSASSDSHHVKLIIKDNGKGVPKEQLEKVFEAFYRLDSTIEGSGLGLYFCKRVIERLNGQIALDSKLEQGTTVTITLPLKST